VALTAKTGVPAGRLTLVAVVAFTGELSIGWCNDAFDAARDAAAGRTDKPIATGTVSRRAVAVAGVVTLVATLAGGFVIGVATGLVNLAMMAAGWAYNAGVKSTAASGLAYVVGFGLIPVFATSVTPGHPGPGGWTVAAAATLGVGAHFANVLPDLQADRVTGVRGLPQRVAALPRGDLLVRVIALVLLVAASAMIALAPGRSGGWPAVAGFTLAVLLALVAAVARGRGPFLAALGIAALDVVLFVALT